MTEAHGALLAVHETTARVGPPTENHIHEDDVARRFGFTGGLVPGVSVYAYMADPVVAQLGHPFLERGAMELNLLQPFYDGEQVRVEMRRGWPGRLDIRALNPGGQVCATGSAWLSDSPARVPAADEVGTRELPGERPRVTHEALSRSPVLGTVREVFDEQARRSYLEEIPETRPAGGGPAPIAPTGFLIRRANSALVANFILPAWVHVSSVVTHHSTLAVGEALLTRSRITDLFERKGHHFVRLDVLLTGDGDRPVMHVDHTAIYRLRGS